MRDDMGEGVIDDMANCPPDLFVPGTFVVIDPLEGAPLLKL
jgi:hypothetical protein